MRFFITKSLLRKIILITVLLIFLIHSIKFFSSSTEEFTYQNEKEFFVEFKDLNLSYYYYGYGDHSCGRNSEMLIATMSRPNASDLRMAVRNSWKKDILSLKITQRFFVGSTTNETLRKLLKKESNEFRDIVFTDIIDSYLNLTLKMASVYQWQQYYCPDVEYFLRADEDTVLDVSRLQYWREKEFDVIKKNLNGMAIFGHHLKNGPVLRNSAEKWYVPYEAYNKTTHYPDYTIGASYLTTSYSIKLMIQEAKNHKHVTVDDAFFTGIIAEALNITRINSASHFWAGDLLNQSKHQCDEKGVPYLFSISDDNGEIETVSNGYNIALKKLKELSCA